MKFILALYLFTLPLYSKAMTLPDFTVKYAQPAPGWTQEEINKANTASNVNYLTDEEKKIIFYMNLVRMDGPKFFDTYFQDYVDMHNQQMKKYSNYNDLKINRYDPYYRGLKEDLKNVKNLSLLYPDESLSYVAKQHGKDMNKHNVAGHNSYDGRTMVNRIEKYYPNRGMAENLAFGFSTGLANVSLLLLDQGVADLGHRKNILNNTLGLNIVGVSIQPHPHYKYSATMDFVAIPNLKPI
ncbi:CAP domain-containing protein [Pedobacter duraquae]|uniref:Cysteine-rich secretory protein family protein n=1 Tax=Pedobacter duraquae TaxID=425511 RepID=A0A4R6ILR2_9SPHI|nr:CAP domain-containing protein [Pedobacter duraquae]TDO23052.1 Cysteine-rich secretory protein family protein [Pedobacter duraquae]